MTKKTHNLADIRTKNTLPELIIRKELYSRGFRYNIHCKALPGTPDIVIKKYGIVIMVNGCFWHAHRCDLFKQPKTNAGFWKEKFNSNRERDAKNIKMLRKLGWRIIIIWECSLKKNSYRDVSEIVDKVQKFIDDNNNILQIAAN